MLDTLKRTDFGTQMDLSRASGIMLYTGGLVYDWCYSELTDAEKQAFIKEFVRIAGTMECGYPPKRTEPIAGHCSEWMIMRDMLSCGIAIYDEYPDMYNYVMEMLVEDYLPPRNYFYSGGNYHQGTSYNNVRFSNDLFCQWILNKMGAGDFFSRDQRYVLYDILYRRRPDGQVLPAGDTNHSHGTWAGFGLPMFLAASYYEDPYLEYDWEKKQSVDNHCLIFRVLWQDLSLPTAAPDDLPLSRYSGSPFGWMLARTSWGDDAVIAEMKVNEHFVGNHQHLDGGSFQIYYKGPLAIDSGLYQGTDGGYNCANNKNYTKRTIAHNSLLVYDPSEVFETYNYGGADKTATAANDGGQRMPGKGWETVRSYSQLMSEDYTVGETLAHGFGPDKNKPDYTYLKGDITQAYSSKVQDVRRSFVFMNMKETDVPAVMVVFDHIVASDPSFKKYWLLHSIEEPQISGNSFTVSRTLDGDSGMLKCDMLYPEAEITKVGGEGKEFWVFGKNYATAPTASRPDYAKEYGQWRIEETPSAASAEDIFLNVIQVADNGCTTLKEVGKIDSDKIAGAAFGDRAVTFSKSGKPLDSDFTFTVPATGEKKLHILVTDLEPGTWSVTCDGKNVKSSVKAGEEDGAVYLTSGPGEYRFTRK
jgi:heparin/heparan-sulfate lyase